MKIKIKASDIEKAKVSIKKLDEIIAKEYAKELNRIKAGESDGK